MNRLPTLSLFGMNCTLYGLLAAVFYLVLAGAMVFFAPAAKRSRLAVGMHMLLTGFLGLLLGRGIYCLIRADALFYDEIGEFLGIGPFFDLSCGGVSFVGALMGIMLAALITRLFTKVSVGGLMDYAVLPGLLFYIAMRLIAPLAGLGKGDLIENPALSFAPLARTNEWGDWYLAINNVEVLLAAIVAITVLLLKKTVKKEGTLSLYAFTLFILSLIIPEHLTRDDHLTIFVFARINHIGMALTLFFCMLIPLVKGAKRGLRPLAFVVEMALLVLGLGLCILAIFAFDKITAWPAEFVYAGWTLVLVLLTLLIGRRIYKEDHREY
ncbi:MAG: hypothetical protein E7324_03820 [Clostridiales bacterium]|nr:hypothetical protein [Clostridiales bacterium]